MLFPSSAIACQIRKICKILMTNDIINSSNVFFSIKRYLDSQYSKYKLSYC